MTNNKTSEVSKMLALLDTSNLAGEAKKKQVLTQELLQDLFLTYLIDIKKQTDLKLKDEASTYPTDLVSSLKVFADLYFKIKNENSNLKIGHGAIDNQLYVYR